ncbi:hypothetical protein AQUCO_00200979v1 [Aquilegia coerulea]|uniref:Uncharacterized protein n=1 Tax=Aquilegia coerulea TaxID=218851 RepID=A0A2G5F5S7_AQUCA|nr:hypothetical protein AQUCO_00200979v1 [Aquilegia coerulea]
MNNNSSMEWSFTKTETTIKGTIVLDKRYTISIPNILSTQFQLQIEEPKHIQPMRHTHQIQPYIACCKMNHVHQNISNPCITCTKFNHT